MADLSRWAGQFFILGFSNEELNEVAQLMAQGRLGGVIFFERNGRTAEALNHLCRELLKAARCGRAPFPVLAVDQEQGRVCRIREGVTLFPSPWDLGALDDPMVTRRVARWVAKELSGIGINLNLAPVADVLEEACCQGVLGGRSFGSDPPKVARHVGAWVRGSQEGGVASCPKHFPGHGRASCDTHTDISWDTSDMDTLRMHHLLPFRRAVATGAPCIMMSHVIYPALDRVLPASLSRSAIQGLLRDEMGFAGLIMTDDLEMGAVSSKMDPLRASILALQAGADMALIGRNLSARFRVSELIVELEDAVKRGHVEESRLEGSLRRIWDFKSRWISAPKERGPFTLKGAMRLSKRLEEELAG